MKATTSKGIALPFNEEFSLSFDHPHIEMNHNFVSLDRCLVVFFMLVLIQASYHITLCVLIDGYMKASCVQSFDFRETKYQSHFQSLSELLLTVACPLFPLN